MPVKKKPVYLDTRISESEISTIMSLYKIGSWSRVHSIDQGNKKVLDDSNSGTSRKAFLNISGNLYILKEIPWYCAERGFVDASTKFQQELLHKGICVPHIVVSQAGDGFVEIAEKDGSSFFVLQEIGHGLSWNGSNKQIKGLSDFLGFMHAASFDISRHESGRKLPQENVFSIVLNMLGFSEEEIKEKNPNISKSESDNLSTLFSSFNRDLQNLISREQSYDMVRIGVHGDYNPTNVLFGNNGEVTAVFDFDNAAMDNPVHDLAQAILHTCFFPFQEGTSKLGSVPEFFDKERAKIIFQSYAHSSPFEEAYLKSILPGAVRAVSMELSILGLLTGSYHLSDIQRLTDVPEKVEAAIKNVLTENSLKRALGMGPSPC